MDKLASCARRVRMSVWTFSLCLLSLRGPALGQAPPSANEPTSVVTADAGVSDVEVAEGDAASDATLRAELPPDDVVWSEAPTDDVSQDIVVSTVRVRTPAGPTIASRELTRKDLDGSSVSNTQGLVRYIVGASSVTGASTAGPSGSVASGINLRGLGPGATLLLLNGRRMNPSGAAVGGAHFGDLSTIPLAAVERVETLQAGASALFGSDAIAGVINVVTRRKWEGLRVQADARATTQALDSRELNASVSFGTAGERGRMLTALSYFRRSELNADTRAFSADKFQSVFGGYPGYFYLPGEMRYVADPLCGRTAPVSESTLVAAGPGMSRCRTGYRDSITLYPETERANAFTSAQYDLSDHVTAFGELLVSRYRGSSVPVPYSVVAGLPPGRPVVPATHVDNPFAQTAVAFISPLGQQSERGRTRNSDDSLRGVVGLKADLGATQSRALSSWEFELSASFGVSRYREAIIDVLKERLQQALDSCSDPMALAGCYNPFSSANDGTGTPNSPAVLERIFSRQVLQADHALSTYAAHANGTLLELPFGDVRLALGGEVRREVRVTDLDHDANLFAFGFLGGNNNAQAQRQVVGGHAELRWPLYQGIVLQLVGRAEHYSDVLSTPAVLAPFAGIAIRPAEVLALSTAPAFLQSLQLRGSASQSVRPPTLFNTYPGTSTFPAPLSFQGERVYAAAQVHGNPQLLPERAFTTSFGASTVPIPGLDVSLDYWSYAYRNRIQAENPQLVLDRFAGDPSRVMRDAATGSLSTVQLYMNNLEGTIFTHGIDFAAQLTLDGADLGAQDAGHFKLGVQGVYTIGYDVPRSMLPGAPSDCEGVEPLSVCHVAGKRNGGAGSDPPALPRLRMNVPVSWTLGGHTLTLLGQYISGLTDDVAAEPQGSDDGGRIPAWFTLDLQYAFALSDVIGRSLIMRVGCDNVFDRRPPTPNGGQEAFLSELHDARGRMIYARLQADF